MGICWGYHSGIARIYIYIINGEVASLKIKTHGLFSTPFFGEFSQVITHCYIPRQVTHIRMCCLTGPLVL